MGTKAGDLLICAVADRLNALCPTRAIVGRVGGDAFGILLPSLARETNQLADRILQAFHDQPIVAGLSSLHLTVYIGSIGFVQEQKRPASVLILPTKRWPKPATSSEPPLHLPEIRRPQRT